MFFMYEMKFNCDINFIINTILATQFFIVRLTNHSGLQRPPHGGSVEQ